MGNAYHRARGVRTLHARRTWVTAVIRRRWRKEEAELSETAFSSSRSRSLLTRRTERQLTAVTAYPALNVKQLLIARSSFISRLSSDSIRDCDSLLLARVLILLAEHSLKWVQNCPLRFITRVIHGFYPCLLSVHGRIDPTLVSSPESLTNFNRTTYSGNGCAADLILRITCTHLWSFQLHPLLDRYSRNSFTFEGCGMQSKLIRETTFSE